MQAAAAAPLKTAGNDVVHDDVSSWPPSGTQRRIEAERERAHYVGSTSRNLTGFEAPAQVARSVSQQVGVSTLAARSLSFAARTKVVVVVVAFRAKLAERYYLLTGDEDAMRYPRVL